MITQLIRDSLSSNVLDVTTVSALLFFVILVIYFFVAIKPSLDSKIRVNNQVRRRLENDRANQIYYEKTNQNRIKAFKAGGGTVPVKKNTVLSKSKNNGFYKKDKGYQTYLKRNSKLLQNKQVIKHQRFKKVLSIKGGSNSDSSKPLRPNQGRMPSGFIGDIPLARKPVTPSYTGPTNSFVVK